MGSHGIRDRVAIVGMGCTRFAEHWDKGVDELLLDATGEAFSATGIRKDDIDAYWLGTAQSGMSGMVLAKPLGLEGKPVTRVENMCATGSEALRQAAYAVASGAYDVAMAVGVEKVKDSVTRAQRLSDPHRRHQPHAHRGRHVLDGGPAYAERYGVGRAAAGAGPDRLQEPRQRRPQPRAQFRREMSVEQICALPAVAGDLSVFDCAGVAAARPRWWCGPRTPPLHRPTAVHQGAVVRGRQRLGADRSRLRLHDLPRGRPLCGRRLRASRRDRPRAELAMAEVHDCFTPTELVLLEDLGFAERAPPGGRCWPAPSTSTATCPSTPTGAQVVRPPGRCQRAAHAVRGLAPAAGRGAARARHPHRQARHLALTHNLGGYPGEMVSFVSIVGSEPSS